MGYQFYGSAEIFALSANYQISDLEFAADGKQLVSIATDGRLRVWETTTWTEIIDLQVHDGMINRMAVSPDSSLIATAGADGKVKIFDAFNWRELLQLDAHAVNVGHPFYDGVMDVTFSPDGNRLVTAGVDRNVSIWNPQTGDQILTFAAPAFLTRVVNSPDGRYIAFSGGPTSGIWDASNGQLLQTISPDDWLSPVNKSFWSIDFDSDSTRMALGRMDGVFEVWKLPAESWGPGEQGAQLLYKGQSEADFLFALRFSPDGEHLILGGGSGAIEVRDAASGELQLRLQYPDGLWELEPTSDGNQLAIVGFDGGVQVVALDLDELIALAHSRLTRSFTIEECQTYLHINACPAGE